jgi:GNAT superfamily N-acetyltransferase
MAEYTVKPLGGPEQRPVPAAVSAGAGHTALSILPIVGDDLPFVRTMLYEAAFWRGMTGAPPLEAALRDPALAIYVDGWGRQGDQGLLARVGGTPVGAVWVRRFHDEAHGYGYVDERTPELSIAVAADHRGNGLGRCLVTAMLVELRLAGTRQVSLSVETDNPARLLYERLGFEPRTTSDGAVTMVRPLD